MAAASDRYRTSGSRNQDTGLTVRIPRRRRWWVPITGLGMAGARRIEHFFGEHPQLTERARALVAIAAPQDVRSWECIAVTHDVDGSRGNFRAPRKACVLRADNDYEAIQAWLSLHESPATQRAYRRRLNACCCGRSSSAAAPYRRSPPRMLSPTGHFCADRHRARAGRDRRARVHRRNGNRSLAGCRRARPHTVCRCSAPCSAG